MEKFKSIRKLYPNVVIMRDDIAYDANNNEVTYDNTAVETEIAKNAYKEQRASAYPQLEEQLDMLWHAIDSNTLDKTSNFYTTLKQVKDTYPKESS